MQTPWSGKVPGGQALDSAGDPAGALAAPAAVTPKAGALTRGRPPSAAWERAATAASRAVAWVSGCMSGA